MSSEPNFYCLKEKRKQYEIKTAKPAAFFNHDLDSKGSLAQSQSTEQSSEQQASEQSTISK